MEVMQFRKWYNGWHRSGGFGGGLYVAQILTGD
jgi:hypothetical protein